MDHSRLFLAIKRSLDKNSGFILVTGLDELYDVVVMTVFVSLGNGLATCMWEKVGADDVAADTVAVKVAAGLLIHWIKVV